MNDVPFPTPNIITINHLPISKKEIEESIVRILFMLNSRTTRCNTLVGILSITYCCSDKRILEAIDSLAEQHNVTVKYGLISLLGGNKNMKQLNYFIRQDIRSYINTYGPQDTRFLISHFAAKYATSKQRICGNISAMSVFFASISIIPNPPHSMAY